MKLTTPKDMELDIEQIYHVLQLFENQFKDEKKGEKTYHLVISGEVHRPLCDAVEQYYINAGWDNVTCMTSSENGERDGLTGLQLSVPS